MKSKRTMMFITRNSNQLEHEHAYVSFEFCGYIDLCVVLSLMVFSCFLECWSIVFHLIKHYSILMSEI